MIKKLKLLYSYIHGGYATLSNWPSFIADLIRVRLGLRTKTKVYRLRDGTKFNIHENSKGLNYVFFTVFIKNEYDCLNNFEIKEDDTVIDIGAHLGFFTVKAAKKAVKGTIYALEPFSMHFRLLKTNIEENGIKNIKYFNEGISDHKGEISFYYTQEGDPSDTSMFKINPSKKTYEEKIKVLSLNDFFQREEIINCNFLKIDCEGAEYPILMNADTYTLKKIQKIAMEWHRFSDDQDPGKLAEFLKENGFKIIEPSSYDQSTGLLYAYR